MKKKVLAIIPARAGSKSIKNKNILNFLGKPLLAWTIEHCLKSKQIDETYLLFIGNFMVMMKNVQIANIKSK